MNDTLLVSIVIPVYNGVDYLREAIDSALGQTYQNIEVVVVNDGSSDGGQTEAIAKAYGDQIRYFYKENGGTASALNAGIKNMRGEWFAWLSHDDLFAANRIEEDIKLLQDMPEAKVVFCNHKTIDAAGNVIGQRNYPPKITKPGDAFGVDMCTMTIHKTCFDQVGLFNEANRTTQDVEMTLRLSNKFLFYLNDKALTYKRDHPNRGTRTLSEQHKKDLLLLSDFIHDELSLQSFFPHLSDDEDEIAEAWIWMGNKYYGFGAAHYGDECYRLAVSTQTSVVRRWFWQVWLRVRKINNPVLNKLFGFIYRPRQTRLYRRLTRQYHVQ